MLESDETMPVAEPEAEAPVSQAGPDMVEAPKSPEAPEGRHGGPEPSVAPEGAFAEAAVAGVTWVPFAVYMGLWVLLAGLSAFFLYSATPGQPARWMPEYEPLLWGGVALTALGPLLSLVVWWASWLRRPPAGRRGLFAVVMTRGATGAFFGVLLWLGTLFILELIASGWTL